VRVTAAGACHSDTFIMSLPSELFGFGLPLTLGHEGVGVVDAVGAGVDESIVGGAYAIYGSWGCGQCRTCASGRENYCERAGALGIRPPGLGAPGAMADYVIVDSPRHLVPLEGLDPVVAVGLTDAGLTPYHAINGSRDVLAPGATAVVIGIGGLGHVAIQMLRALTSARVIALDVAPSKLELARRVGAHEVVESNDDAAARIRELTGGLGVNAVFDFVVIQPTIDLGKSVIRMGGDQVLVGVGMGSTGVGFIAGPYDWRVRAPYWGSLPELYEVLDLARAGDVNVVTETFSLEDAPLAYERLHEGSLEGRAVVVP
jgi:propanol-preferring alcohol dehydrogenase